MPELPEVETVVRTIRPGLVGQSIVNVRVGRKRLRVPWQRRWCQSIDGQGIVTVSRRGKWIIIELDHGAMLGHLGMTGQLTIGTRTGKVDGHTHLVFALFNGTQLQFRDERRFGSWQFFENVKSLHDYLDLRLGPEPFALDAGYWRAALAQSQRAIKAVLLDQSVIAGVGNIYADESLFAARIHPQRPASLVAARQATALRNSVERVLTRAIECHGSSIRNYLDGAGNRGDYQQEFQAYGRTGAPCRRCRTAIERVRVAGRSSHFCPQCQRMD